MGIKNQRDKDGECLAVAHLKVPIWRDFQACFPFSSLLWQGPFQPFIHKQEGLLCPGILQCSAQETAEIDWLCWSFPSIFPRIQSNRWHVQRLCFFLPVWDCVWVHVLSEFCTGLFYLLRMFLYHHSPGYFAWCSNWSPRPNSDSTEVWLLYNNWLYLRLSTWIAKRL